MFCRRDSRVKNHKQQPEPWVSNIFSGGVGERGRGEGGIPGKNIVIDRLILA